MTILVNGERKEVSKGISLRQVLLNFSPYGEEATIVIHNGASIKSIDLENDDILVSEGDRVDIVPLIIGG